mmetsp:Transcript_10905/g.20550  ORF Transcript_10905/g.20550 Transcript_10905/m.20550 type:complete len:243 (+) Transcript_10905:79-807(+)
MQTRPRRSVSCLYRIRPDVLLLLNDPTHPAEVREIAEKVLHSRECTLWTTGIEIVVAALSFVGFDIRRSPLVLVVSSSLVLLATVGFRGTLVLSQVQIALHLLLATSIPAAVCVNFVVEDIAGVFDDGTSRTPSWLLLLLLMLPYVVFLCLATSSLMLWLAMIELGEKLAEDSVSSSDDVEIPSYYPQDTCCICAAAPKDSALVPCGHKATCQRCAEQVRARGLGCPVCRSHIDTVVRVFDS